jgi:hypothetical protein
MNIAAAISAIVFFVCFLGVVVPGLIGYNLSLVFGAIVLLGVVALIVVWIGALLSLGIRAGVRRSFAGRDERQS